MAEVKLRMMSSRVHSVSDQVQPTLKPHSTPWNFICRLKTMPKGYSITSTLCAACFLMCVSSTSNNRRSLTIFVNKSDIDPVNFSSYSLIRPSNNLIKFSHSRQDRINGSLLYFAFSWCSGRVPLRRHHVMPVMPLLRCLIHLVCDKITV